MLGAVWVVADEEEIEATLLELFEALDAPVVAGGLSIDVSVTVGMSKTANDGQMAGLTIVDRAVVAVIGEGPEEAVHRDRFVLL